LTIRYRTVGYLIGMLGGLLCEIIGYVGRIMMHSNPFIDTNFIMYLVCLTIGPAFLSASIYLCLSRIVIIGRRRRSRLHGNDCQHRPHGQEPLDRQPWVSGRVAEHVRRHLP